MTEFIKKYKAFIIEAVVFIALLAVDLISKSAVFKFLQGYDGKYVVWEGIFQMTEVHNYGASFGIFSGKTQLLSIITGMVSVALIVFLIIKPKAPKLFRIGLIAIITGGLGNLYDRVVLGYVRDFIDYTFLETFFGIDFAVGNIADIFVLVGVLCVIVYIAFEFKDGDFSKNKQSDK